ncbi:MAG: 2-C-methyl-D-erythritol 2,4-cyclodiphosphate synthase [Clostridiales bacterium]|jgi:2-C-methyl-D-erythritol 4-phosphate cytidylyltransferase/2-C-methyl-D-erythritol 2,4-cyclodiphosphate synthase|nr:2-C-methyl-D-erythritol 2,4-cyclodiphosphate synthase [Clostridiales bacterium]
MGYGYAGKTVVMIMAAGNGSRAGTDGNKLLYPVNGFPLLAYTLELFTDYPVVVVAREVDFAMMSALAAEYSNVTVTLGGGTRGASVRLGLAFIADCDLVVIHDGARPYLTKDTLDRVIAAAGEHGAAVAFARVTDTVKAKQPGGALATLNRDELLRIQTPQAYDFQLLTEALAKLPGDYTDESQVFERIFHPCAYVESDPGNEKITTSADITRFEALMREDTPPKVGEQDMRIGNGYDKHRFERGRRLLLGGVEVPHYEGLAGHSDGDALCHAVADALLAAVGEKDIGALFPDTDEKTLDMPGAAVVAGAIKKLEGHNVTVSNMSAVVVTERPKLQQYVPKIRAGLAKMLNIDQDRVGITCKTKEGTDDKTLEVHAVVLLKAEA